MLLNSTGIIPPVFTGTSAPVKIDIKVRFIKLSATTAIMLIIKAMFVIPLLLS
jgi:hypothetical protein